MSVCLLLFPHHVTNSARGMNRKIYNVAGPSRKEGGKEEEEESEDGMYKSSPINRPLL